jgi:CubicO group peptidase (beta-lactamase class C family)
MGIKTILVLCLFTSVACLGQKRYQEVFDDYAKNHNFNGSVLIATNGKIDFYATSGIANRQNNQKIDVQTKFKIASITKTFTAVLILKLYENGKLDFNATIGKYLPEYTGEGRDKVTIHHLLTYSSGIPNCEGNTGIGVYQTQCTADEFIAKYCSGNLEFDPGKQFNYNNGDYIILGKIIENITKKSFLENLKEVIFTPLKMEQTGMLMSKDIVDNLANTYNIDDSTGTFYNDDPMYIENYYSAGAMYSTIEDLYKFDQGIFTNKLLSKKTVDLMLTPYPELYGVGYGFWIYEQQMGNAKITLANRQGSIWGANANWLHVIDSNQTFIILSNTNATSLPELTEQLMKVSLKLK